MEQKVLPFSEKTLAEEEPQQKCVHHWLIDPADGPVSKGICKVCGEKRDFLNAIAESLWYKLEKKDEGVSISPGDATNIDTRR